LNGTRPDEPPYPRASYAWWVAGVLSFAYLVSFVDRQVLAVLVEPIRRDLRLSDTAISLLLGLAFGLFYALMGLPLGRLADRVCRKCLIVTGILLWTLMTFACGLAGSYWQLFLARMGVGVGEATLGPSALSIISDYFPRAQRGGAVSLYHSGIGFGSGLALIVGGALVQSVQGQPPRILPVIGAIHAWQLVFFWVALPGLLAAVLLLFVREPVRRGQMALAGGQAASWLFVVRYLRERWRVFVPLIGALAATTVLGYAYLSWVPTLFMRTWGWSIKDIGLVYGVLVMTVGPLGAIGGGAYADWLYRRGVPGAHVQSAFVGALLLTAWQAVMPLMPTGAWAVAALVPSAIGGPWVAATGLGALTMICPNQLRGQILAIYYLIISLVGATLGPTAVALATDYVFKDTALLKYSLASVCAVFVVVTWVLLRASRPGFQRALTEAETWSRA
jgi:MFS family permease